jgi:hypothetical protein
MIVLQQPRTERGVHLVFLILLPGRSAFDCDPPPDMAF